MDVARQIFNSQHYYMCGGTENICSFTIYKL